MAEWVSEQLPQESSSAVQPRAGGTTLAAKFLAPAGVLVCVAAVWLVATSVPSDQAFGRGLVELLIVGTPIAAGLYVLRSPANRRFALALIGIGSAWSVTALAESSHSVPFTIGRLSTWLILPGAVFLLFSFPSGRITNRFDRAAFGGFV